MGVHPFLLILEIHKSRLFCDNCLVFSPWCSIIAGITQNLISEPRLARFVQPTMQQLFTMIHGLPSNMADSNSNLDTPSRASSLLLTLSVIVLACLNLSQNQRSLVMRTGLLTNAITINQTYRFLKVIDYHVKELSSEIIRSLRSLYPILYGLLFIISGVTGICVSQGCVFPAHISLGMRVSPHTYH